MAALIPKHHVKGEVCDTRSAYREGRLRKAVKVYTINKESRYLLVQGVPAVGGSKELVKLFAVYGAIEEYRILDDYPAEEFTEVYLFKFKKIQSARFAKRKLDDYSFFGGVLHVCYSPEYETVEETREKLQDRRKVVAAKIRQHAASFAEQVSPSVGEGVEAVHRQSEPEVTTITNTNSPVNTVYQQHSKHESATNSHVDAVVHMGDNSCPVETLVLPPPPIDMGRHGNRGAQPRGLHSGRVPCAHATLPPNYDGRIDQSGSLRAHDCCHGDRKIIDNPFHDMKNENGSIKNGGKATSDFRLNEKKSLVVLKYTKPGQIPKFIPRQAVKKSDVTEAISVKSKGEGDALNKEIRVNAFTLGKSQGPTMPAEKDKVVIDPDNQKSVNQTVKDIRKRISKFISDTVPQQKKIKES